MLEDGSEPWGVCLLPWPGPVLLGQAGGLHAQPGRGCCPPRGGCGLSVAGLFLDCRPARPTGFVAALPCIPGISAPAWAPPGLSPWAAPGCAQVVSVCLGLVPHTLARPVPLSHRPLSVPPGDGSPAHNKDSVLGAQGPSMGLRVSGLPVQKHVPPPSAYPLFCGSGPAEGQSPGLMGLSWVHLPGDP